MYVFENLRKLLFVLHQLKSLLLLRVDRYNLLVDIVSLRILFLLFLLLLPHVPREPLAFPPIDPWRHVRFLNLISPILSPGDRTAFRLISLVLGRYEPSLESLGILLSGVLVKLFLESPELKLLNFFLRVLLLLFLAALLVRLPPQVSL